MMRCFSTVRFCLPLALSPLILRLLPSFFPCPSFDLGALTDAPPTDSGHGGQTPDLDGDEVDGYDEGVSFSNPYLVPT
jgi:hypothetical protein